MKQRKIKGVINEILKSKDKRSSFEIFLNEEVSLANLNHSNPVDESMVIRKSVYKKYLVAIEAYKSILKDPANIALFNKMKNLETYISNSRSIIDTNIKLSEVNQNRGKSDISYIVARAPFYIPDNLKAEIRVYLGKKEEIGKEVDKLSKDQKFLDHAEVQIVHAMKEILDQIDIDLK